LLISSNITSILFLVQGPSPAPYNRYRINLKVEPSSPVLQILTKFFSLVQGPSQAPLYQPSNDPSRRTHLRSSPAPFHYRYIRVRAVLPNQLKYIGSEPCSPKLQVVTVYGPSPAPNLRFDNIYDLVRALLPAFQRYHLCSGLSPAPNLS